MENSSILRKNWTVTTKTGRVMRFATYSTARKAAQKQETVVVYKTEVARG